MKTRVLIVVIFLVLGATRASLKLVTDQGEGGAGQPGPKAVHSQAKKTKQVGKIIRARKLQRIRGRGRPARSAAMTRPVSDKTLVDIHTRTINGPLLDPRAATARQQPATQCDLYAEFEPMYYTLITRTASTVIHFSSNCLPRTTLNVESIFGQNRNINWAYHPTTFYLNVLGNLYQVRYSRPRVIDRRDILRSLRYATANIVGTFNPPANIDLGSQNSVYLAPHVANSFTPAGLRRMRNLRGHWSCQTRPRRFSNYQNRIRLRRIRVNKLRKDGFSEREVSRLIRGMPFGPRANRFANVETPRQVAGLDPMTPTPAGRPAVRAQRRGQRRQAPARPRNLEVTEAKSGEAALSDTNTEPGDPDSQNNRNLQSISSRVQSAINQHQRSRGRSGTRNRRRGRRSRRPQRRRPQAVSRYEQEEERQRLENRRFILQRLRNNFIWELVTVCTLR